MLNETSYNRFASHSKLHDCGIITAFRGDKSLAENMRRNKALLSDIQSLRLRDGTSHPVFGVTKVKGEYQELDMPKASIENSFLVVNLLDKPNFKEKLKEWGRKYDQDSVYYIPAGGKPRYIWTSPHTNSEEYGYETPPASDRLIGNTRGRIGRTRIKHKAFSDNIDFNFKKMEESQKYKHSFNQVYESYFSRYTAGMFGMGDVVEFDKAIFNDPMFKSLAPDLKTAVQDMIEASIAGDAIVAVAKTDLDQRLQDQFEPATITIAYSQGGGMYYGNCTIPGSLGQYMKRTGDVYQHIPKRAIRIHDGGTRQPVDMNTVAQAFNKGYCTDVRAQGQPKR